MYIRTYAHVSSRMPAELPALCTKPLSTVVEELKRNSFLSLVLCKNSSSSANSCLFQTVTATWETENPRPARSHGERKHTHSSDRRHCPCSFPFHSPFCTNLCLPLARGRWSKLRWSLRLRFPELTFPASLSGSACSLSRAITGSVVDA